MGVGDIESEELPGWPCGTLEGEGIGGIVGDDVKPGEGRG